MNQYTIQDGKIQKGQRVIGCVEQNAYSRDVFKEIGDGVWEWIRRVDVSDMPEDTGKFSMALTMAHGEDFYMIPCVNYNGNGWGEGKEPKGLEQDGKPWYFSFSRSGIPAGMYGQNEDAAISLWADPKLSMGSSCSLSRAKQGGLRMTLLFPEMEGPECYCARDTYEKQNYVRSAAIQGPIVEFRGYLMITERNKAYDYGTFLDTVWKMFPSEHSNRQITDTRLWELGVHWIMKHLYFEQEGFKGFCMGLTWNGEMWEQKRDFLEIGWVGQNASLAVSLLYHYACHGDKTALHMGLQVLDGWMKAALENGLFRCRYDRVLKYGKQTENREERQDAANLYYVIMEYLEAYEILKKLGIEREEYVQMVWRLCDFVVEHRIAEKGLGKAWYNDGTCSDEDGTVGCYLAEGLCAAWDKYGSVYPSESGTGDRAACWLNTAIEAYQFYYGEFQKKGYTTAGALDTCCVDKESAIPLLRCALKLYEITEEKAYLQQAEDVAYYLATWQYHYDIPYEKNTLLGQLDYGTRGGTAVSVQHHHIDCYGLEFYDSWKKLSKYTGKAIWAERAEAMWRNSHQLISDGTLMIKGQKRPMGSQDEGILQTRWHTKKGEYYGVSEWLVTWNTAFRLKILRKEYLANIAEKDKESNRK